MTEAGLNQGFLTFQIVFSSHKVSQCSERSFISTQSVDVCHYVILL